VFNDSAQIINAARNVDQESDRRSWFRYSLTLPDPVEIGDVSLTQTRLCDFSGSGLGLALSLDGAPRAGIRLGSVAHADPYSGNGLIVVPGHLARVERQALSIHLGIDSGPIAPATYRRLIAASDQQSLPKPSHDGAQFGTWVLDGLIDTAIRRLHERLQLEIDACNEAGEPIGDPFRSLVQLTSLSEQITLGLANNLAHVAFASQTAFARRLRESFRHIQFRARSNDFLNDVIE
jgi:hypothetical protein